MPRISKKTIGRGKKAPKEIEEIKQLILNLSEAGRGRMFISRTKNGLAGSIAFYGIDHKRGYFLFGANDPEMRDEHTGTAVLCDSFYLLNQLYLLQSFHLHNHSIDPFQAFCIVTILKLDHILLIPLTSFQFQIFISQNNKRTPKARRRREHFDFWSIY